MTFFTLALLVVASGGSFAAGWALRRAATSGQEAALKRSMYETKGAIPQLEASVRTRDQRIAMYQGEAESARTRVTQLESTLTQKESEIVKRDREIRRLTSELEITKEQVGDGPAETTDPFTGEIVQSTPSPGSPDVEARLKKTEARYETLKRGIIQRDERIVALEQEVREVKGRTGSGALEDELEELTQSAQTLTAALAERDTVMKDLEARVQREAEQREILESLAKRRSDANRELKEKLAKLEVQLPKLMETMKARLTVIAERDATIRALGSELEHVKGERADRDTTIVDLERQIAARDQDIATRDARIESLQQNMHELERRIDTLTHEVSAATRAIQRAEGVVRERDATLAAQAAKVESAESREHEHEQAMASLTSAVRDRDFRIDALSTDMLKMNAALETALKESSAASASQTDVSGRFANEVKVARERADAMSRQHDALQKEHAARERKHAELERKGAELERERARLAERVAALEGSGDSRLHALETQLAASRDRCQRVEDELLAAAKEAKTLRGRVAQLESGAAASGSGKESGGSGKESDESENDRVDAGEVSLLTDPLMTNPLVNKPLINKQGHSVPPSA